MISPAEKELLARLGKYADNERKTGAFDSYSPEGMLQAKKIMGNPDLALVSIHVAGTNGKGSVCHMLADTLTRSGYRTGLYTSPHLESVCERIRVDGEPIAPEKFLSLVELIEISLAGKDISLTWFDMVTLAALLHFSNSWVDAAVIETGLGGRLDSTNIITPAASVITDISLDHRHILGNTVECIAGEKAGIMKPGIPCVTTAADADAAAKVLLDHARKTGSHLALFGSEYHADRIDQTAGGIRFDYSDERGAIRDIELPLPGLFQAKNAAAVIRTLRLLGETFPNVTDRTMRDALAAAHVPGRMETLCESPRVIFDPAHNRQALESLLDTLSRRFNPADLVFYVCFMADKEPDALTGLLRAKGGRIIYCTIEDPRAYRPEPGSFERIIPADAKSLAGAMLSDGGVSVVTGSFRLYAAAKEAAGLLLDNASSGGEG